MNEELAYQFLEAAASAMAAGYGWRVLRDARTRLFFFLMILCFFLSRLTFVEDELVKEWAKHLPFYVGQVFCYLFLLRLAYPPDSGNDNTENGTMTAAGTAIRATIVIPWNWIAYATEQGLEHILTLPLMLLIVAGIRAHFPFIAAHPRRQLVITGFLWAMLPLTMIHMGEFAVESQRWIPQLEPIIEQLETVLYLSAMSTIAFAVHRYSHV